ncbi:MAG TPA: alpha/beta fold hydrolase [Actinocrinis sp.]|uniref:alpha/beta fold hydrolase n=1 Tax=Actinocrinis sp. TaxID=1920516 RepID=UPI002D520C9B|nr:alpha/beta fold hydrolase [Actinocrinis sp.]HZU58222.1 alpha/beta fold hydrolase [Actinocrinis sp.]
MIVRARDGRTLAVESWGAPDGAPVFLLHGTPGSRFGPRPRVSVLYRLGIRLIAYDRPGYGESDRLTGRAVAHAAADVEAIADDLGLQEFAVVGRSGGGPHALACAVLLGERVSRAAVLVGLAPRDAEGLDWYAGMTASNVSEYMTAEVGPLALAARLGVNAALMRRDPAAHLPFHDPELPEPDRRVVADFGIRSMLVSNFAEAVKTSGLGWVDDAVSFISGWGFDPGDADAPVLFWHGAEDVFSPVRHTLWLARRVPRSTTVIESGAAHFGAVAVLPQVLSWVVVGRTRDWPSAA